MSEHGSGRQPDSWLTLNRVAPERSAHIGIRLDYSNDAVTVVLPSGTILHIYGDGQVWNEYSGNTSTFRISTSIGGKVVRSGDFENDGRSQEQIREAQRKASNEQHKRIREAEERIRQADEAAKRRK